MSVDLDQLTLDLRARYRRLQGVPCPDSLGWKLRILDQELYGPAPWESIFIGVSDALAVAGLETALADDPEDEDAQGAAEALIAHWLSLDLEEATEP